MMFPASTLAPWLVLLPAVQEQASEPPAPETQDEWAISAGLFVFDRPSLDPDLMPIVTADRGALHLELRYNYEELETGSFFVGRNFSFGDELAVDVTPMFGVVAGALDGVAPGLELDLAWKGFEFSTELEYVFDFDSDGEDFFYTWSELTYSPADWLRFGLIGQRTRIFEQEFWIDRGLLLGFAFGAVWVDLYLFNPEGDEPYAGGAIGVDF